MNDITGTWRLRMSTPIGPIEADYEFTRTGDHLTGTADGTPLENLEAHPGDRYTWSQRITKPLRLNLTYDVTVTGDDLTGESRAGRLPRTEVTGRRR